MITWVTANVSVPTPQFWLRFSGDFTDILWKPTVNNWATIVTDGTRGQVARFNGTSNYVTITSAQSWSFTKAVWVYAETGTNMGTRNIMANPSSNIFWISSSRLQSVDYASGSVTIYANDLTSNFPLWSNYYWSL